MKASKWCVVFLAVCLLALTMASSFPAEEGNNPQETFDADQLERMLSEALERFRKGEAVETMNLLGEAMMQIRNNLPLEISKLFMCSEIRDFNDYDAKAGFELKAGEPLLLYIEPEGYGVRKEEGEYRIWISQDVEIKNVEGEVIFQRNNWVDYNKGFPTPVIPFFLTNRITDIPPGQYTYTFTLKDHHKNTFLTKSFQFSVQ